MEITSSHSNGSCSSSSYGKPASRSHDTNGYPTTFVQADTTTFKQVVQMLTGSSRPDPPPPSSAPIVVSGDGGSPLIKSTDQNKQRFNLYERRNSIKNELMINTLIPVFSSDSGISPHKPEILSPSILDLPALVLSPVTPVNEATLSKFSSPEPNLLEEEKAIAEKKFYFHPSPRTTATEPQLLPLFPVTSPRVSGSSS